MSQSFYNQLSTTALLFSPFFHGSNLVHPPACTDLLTKIPFQLFLCLRRAKSSLGTGILSVPGQQTWLRHCSTCTGQRLRDLPLRYWNYFSMADVCPSRWKLSWRCGRSSSWVVFVCEGMEQSRNEGCRAHSKCKVPLLWEFVTWGVQAAPQALGPVQILSRE